MSRIRKPIIFKDIIMRSIKPFKESTEQKNLDFFKTSKDDQLELLKTIIAQYEEEYLTRAEVSKIYKVSPSTVSNWKNEGVINAYGLGGRVYYKRTEINSSMIKIN